MGTKETTCTNNMGWLAPQDEEIGRATWKDPVVRWGKFVTGAEQSMTRMSHPCTDGVLGARHYQRALCEGQMLQDHTCLAQEVR